ncbi:pyridoxamine 5'-phosphate oxidase family protein [Lentzea sp. BCCO 10_0061]|uniref:Pyridoxamine 5'-phosphate oxidase family protein n=1 Tax=Lentzea sokolovensis TaxID=3095429 RepID=A0ABU4V170_9PSEU|nr:pyridoxamine 5'-phosphate oxidase family protein [Lentzea sp. BCCO 10_0061]MDX8145506.1 pyridoxamine 5'-phosphate oxidase family protein [Lentzea sp. BCCO 10_0061]
MTSDVQLSPTPRSTVIRGKKRAVEDRQVLYDILDAGMVCHLSVEVDGAPFLIPTAYGRDGNTIFLHGSTGSRSIRSMLEGKQVCVAVTLVDGVVYSRSVFHHSMNYRSAIVHGTAKIAEDTEHALRTIVEHVTPGSWDYARRPSKKELAQTAALEIDLTEASVKVRDGGPGEEPSDLEANLVWAGHMPLIQSWGAPVPHETDKAIPPHVSERAR